MAAAIEIPVQTTGMGAAGAGVRVLEERTLPLRPRRLGTRRRAERLKAPGGQPATGASRASAASAPSLDDSKHLATTDTETVGDWVKSLETPADRRQQKMYLRRVLMTSLQAIFQDTGAEYHNPERQRDWERVHNCQTEWIGYKAECCNAERLAVPIGCNHRLCPLCAWHRAENGRDRVRKMFSRLSHPYLLTLTVPNLPTIRKHDYTLFRQRVRHFIKAHAGWIRGGIYSLETTYNRREKTWHLHVHILLDAACNLPDKSKFVTYRGRKVRYFTLLKRRLEFAWLQEWNRSWRERRRPRIEDLERVGTLFDLWWDECERHKVREYVAGEWRDLSLTTPERARRVAWNRENRRVVDVKPVHDRDGAAFEVLKYITKVSAFCDDPAAVEAFLRAVRGARLIQTFGSWYGLKLSDDANEHDWSHLNCDCGENRWQRAGVFQRHEVEMRPDGRWIVKHDLERFEHGVSRQRGSPLLRKWDRQLNEQFKEENKQ